MVLKHMTWSRHMRKCLKNTKSNIWPMWLKLIHIYVSFKADFLLILTILALLKSKIAVFHQSTQRKSIFYPFLISLIQVLLWPIDLLVRQISEHKSLLKTTVQSPKKMHVFFPTFQTFIVKKYAHGMADLKRLTVHQSLIFNALKVISRLRIGSQKEALPRQF